METKFKPGWSEWWVKKGLERSDFNKSEEKIEISGLDVPEADVPDAEGVLSTGVWSLAIVAKNMRRNYTRNQSAAMIESGF